MERVTMSVLTYHFDMHSLFGQLGVLDAVVELVHATLKKLDLVISPFNFIVVQYLPPNRGSRVLSVCPDVTWAPPQGSHSRGLLVPMASTYRRSYLLA